MTELSQLGEFGLIERIAQILPGAPTVIEGVGDDCAVVRIFERLMLLTCDTFIENVHFRPAYASAQDIGWKSATSAISDIAAMGGAPLFSLVAVACPAETDSTYVEGLYHGLTDAAGQAGAIVVGGDTTMSPNGIYLDVTVVGEVIGNRYLSRRGAQSGDLLGVTGHLGLSSAGLWSLDNNRNAPVLARAHHRPTARIAEGQWLSGCEHVKAMIDISDGLVRDAGHLAQASHVGVEIDPESLPVDSDLRQFCLEYDLDPLDFVLSGGEDYELAFVIQPDHADECLRTFRREFRTPIFVAGRFTNEWPGVQVAGRPSQRGGYEHFR